MRKPPFTHDVFLSHSAKDKAVVRAVAERLRKDGLRVWFDEWVLKLGDSIPAKIEKGLEHSRVLVLCMSDSAFGSDWAHLAPVQKLIPVFDGTEGVVSSWPPCQSD